MLYILLMKHREVNISIEDFAIQRYLNFSRCVGNLFTYRFYAGKDHFKTKRIKKDNKVFSLYRSMIEKEAEKINSAVLKYIVMFVVIIGLAGAMFKFVFLNKILGMGKTKEIPKTEAPVPPVSEEKGIIQSENLFRIIGIVDDHYIVNTYKGLKRVKIDMNNRKNINDEIKIEKL